MIYQEKTKLISTKGFDKKTDKWIYRLTKIKGWGGVGGVGPSKN